MKNYYDLFYFFFPIFTLVVFFNFDETNLSIFLLVLATLQRKKRRKNRRRRIEVNPTFFFLLFSPLEIITIPRFN